MEFKKSSRTSSPQKARVIKDQLDYFIAKQMRDVRSEISFLNVSSWTHWTLRVEGRKSFSSLALEKKKFGVIWKVQRKSGMHRTVSSNKIWHQVECCSFARSSKCESLKRIPRRKKKLLKDFFFRDNKTKTWRGHGCCQHIWRSDAGICPRILHAPPCRSTMIQQRDIKATKFANH